MEEMALPFDERNWHFLGRFVRLYPTCLHLSLTDLQRAPTDFFQDVCMAVSKILKANDLLEYCRDLSPPFVRRAFLKLPTDMLRFAFAMASRPSVDSFSCLTVPLGTARPSCLTYLVQTHVGINQIAVVDTQWLREDLALFYAAYGHTVSSCEFIGYKPQSLEIHVVGDDDDAGTVDVGTGTGDDAGTVDVTGTVDVVGVTGTVVGVTD